MHALFSTTLSGHCDGPEPRELDAKVVHKRDAVTLRSGKVLLLLDAWMQFIANVDRVL
jgi:hypothetical protein